MCSFVHRIIIIDTWAISGSSSSITTWSAVEVDTGLFCASAPALRPLIRKWRRNILPSNSHTSPTSNRYQQSPKVVSINNWNLYNRRIRLDEGYELNSQEYLQVPVPTSVSNKEHDVQCTYVESDGMHLDDGPRKSPLSESSGSRVRTVKIVSMDVNREDNNDSFTGRSAGSLNA